MMMAPDQSAHRLSLSLSGRLHFPASFKWVSGEGVGGYRWAFQSETLSPSSSNVLPISPGAKLSWIPFPAALPLRETSVVCVGGCACVSLLRALSIHQVTSSDGD